MEIRLPDAVETVLEALQQDQQGVLPFLGAGFSGWIGRDRPREFAASVKRITGSERSHDAAVRSVEAAFCQDLTGRKTRVEELEGAAPSWFLEACLLCLVDAKKLSSAGDNLNSARLASLSQLLYPDARGVEKLATLLGHLYEQGGFQPNVRHRKLSYFPLDVIATTNYDKCMENALKEVGKKPSVANDDTQLKDGGMRYPLVLKLHGGLEERIRGHGENDFRDYVDQVILTHTQYWKFPQSRELVMDYLRVLFASRQVIFLGYGLEDFNIVEQFHLLAKHAGRAARPIILLREAAPHQVDLFHHRGIDVATGDLDDFLERMTLRSFGVKDLDQLQGPGARAGVGRQTGAAVAVLMRMASKHGKRGDFWKALHDVILMESFPRDDLANHSVWQEEDGPSYGAFESVGWARKAESTDGDRDSVWWEFPGDIRNGLNEHLKAW